LSSQSIFFALNRLGPAGTRLIVDAIKFQQRASGPAFKNSQGLKNLYLDSNVIGDAGAAAIAELIGPNSKGFVEVLHTAIHSIPASFLRMSTGRRQCCKWLACNQIASAM